MVFTSTYKGVPPICWYRWISHEVFACVRFEAFKWAFVGNEVRCAPVHPLWRTLTHCPAYSCISFAIISTVVYCKRHVTTNLPRNVSQADLPESVRTSLGLQCRPQHIIHSATIVKMRNELPKGPLAFFWEKSMSVINSWESGQTDMSLASTNFRITAKSLSDFNMDLMSGMKGESRIGNLSDAVIRK